MNNFNINNVLLTGLLVLLFYLFTMMALVKIKGIEVSNPEIMENVIIYILGILSGVVGDKAINNNKNGN